MICTVCWGKGWTRGDGGEKVTCPACGGSGKVEQTNEEWFTSLSTEEKADKLTDFSFWLVPTIPTDERRERIRKKLIEWLKEKHNG